MYQEHYQKALRMGQRDQRTHGGKNLAVIPESMENAALSRENLPILDVPLELIVGTCTEGRNNAFSPDFYPLMPMNTEFSNKWIVLCKAHLSEGLRDPIKAVEYLGKFYVIEGHKRVSVLKYFGAVSVSAMVTRLYPVPSEQKEIQIYYEFLKFYQSTGLYSVQFQRKEGFSELLQLIGYEQPWSADQIRDFRAFFTMFSHAYQANGGRKEQVSEALIAYLRVFDYASSRKKLPSVLQTELQRIQPEVARQVQNSGMTLMLSAQESKRSLLSGLWSGVLQVAFIYGHEPETDSLIYAHELGRRDIESTMYGQIRTMMYTVPFTESAFTAAMEDAIAQGAQVIFVPEREMMRVCVQIAAKYPSVKVLTGALHTNHSLIRTYDLRLYEAKFLAGALAGALTPNDRIAYVYKEKTESWISNINAFALGAQMTNPRAKIALECASEEQTCHVTQEKIFYLDDTNLVSMETNTPQVLGLYDNTGETPRSIAIALCRWGKFYQKMLYHILDGNWKADTNGSSAISYWWGMADGVVDVICSRSLPEGVGQLAQLLKEAICNRRISPFAGTLYDQQGKIRYQSHEPMQPEQILTMDWLAQNVIEQKDSR